MFLYNYLWLGVHIHSTGNQEYLKYLKTLADNSKSCTQLANNLPTFADDTSRRGPLEYIHHNAGYFYSPVRLTSNTMVYAALAALNKCSEDSLNSLDGYTLSPEFINNNYWSIHGLLINPLAFFYEYNSAAVFLTLANTEEEQRIMHHALLTRLDFFFFFV